MYLLIIPFTKKTFDSIWYTYTIEKSFESSVKIGSVVEFFLKDELTYWIVYDFCDNINFDKSKLKEIVWIKNQEQFIAWYRLKLLKYISEEYFTPIHNSLSLFLPSDTKKKIINNKYKTKTYWLSYNINFDIDLNSNQYEAYSKIKQNQKNLLFWVTWSWKTHIYIKLIQDQLKDSKQSLLMIPEIILTTQISQNIKYYFWDDVLIINSTITDATKTKYFQQIKNWEAKVILWTRSSLFYPFNDLGLIIIDEEHDNSYISDQSPRYNSIDIANKITDLNWNMLVLWTWTPSVKTMYNAINWKYNLVNLFEKYKKTD